MIFQHDITAASKILGSNIRKRRLDLGMSPLDLGRKVNETLQQITRYEEGNFIALAKLENIIQALELPIPKKIIRRISTLRKLELELGVEQEELADIYNEIFYH